MKQPARTIENADEDDDFEDANFDWKTLSALCLAPAPSHPIYGMSIAEYGKYQRSNSEEEKHTQLQFRAPAFLSVGISRFARMHRMSLRKYLASAIVIGLTTFQKDYHDTYSLITISYDNAFDSAKDMYSLGMLEQYRKMTVDLHTSSHSNTKYCPSLPEWVSSSIVTVADAINMTQSDLACLCICIAIRNDARDVSIPDNYLGMVREFVDEFELKLSYLTSFHKTRSN